MSQRQIVLDTETTGLDPNRGHRIIEIGCIEMIGRRPTGERFHCYLNPERPVDDGAVQVHGLTNEFLADKPLFADKAREFVDFIRGAELVIHNAPFDVGFLNAELSQMGPAWGSIDEICEVCDTLVMARERHPGQKNSLDALCKRYEVNNSRRELHGALLDAEILAEVYLAMTGGQTDLSLHLLGDDGQPMDSNIRRLDADRPPLRVIHASDDERIAHEERLQVIEESSGGRCVWLATERSDG